MALSVELLGSQADCDKVLTELNDIKDNLTFRRISLADPLQRAIDRKLYDKVEAIVARQVKDFTYAPHDSIMLCSAEMLCLNPSTRLSNLNKSWQSISIITSSLSWITGKPQEEKVIFIKSYKPAKNSLILLPRVVHFLLTLYNIAWRLFWRKEL